jgi:hypothetical protein
VKARPEGKARAKCPVRAVTMPFAFRHPHSMLLASPLRSKAMRSSLPGYMKLWIVADLFLALFPPLQWAARGADPIFGAPIALLYIFATSVLIAASVVTAYLAGQQPSPDGEAR